jgi:hypothetical protein
MIPNLAQQLDEVLDCLAVYWEFHRKLVRISFRPLLSPRRLARSRAVSRRLVRNSRRGHLTLRFPPELREFIALMTTNEEQRSAGYAPYTSEYPLHYTAVALVRRFPQVDFDKIQKLFESRRKVVDRITSLKAWLAIVFAAGSLVLKSVPEPVVTHVFNADNDAFQIAVFWVTVVAMAYTFVLFGLIWVRGESFGSKHRYFQQVLEYTAIAQKDG